MTPPAIDWTAGPTEGGVYLMADVPHAPGCTAIDALSGADTCEVEGYSTAAGLQTMVATATDKGGNTTLDSRTYTVTTDTLHGFYRPVAMGEVWNTVRAGSALSFRFEVFDGRRVGLRRQRADMPRDRRGLRRHRLHRSRGAVTGLLPGLGRLHAELEDPGRQGPATGSP